MVGNEQRLKQAILSFGQTISCAVPNSPAPGSTTPTVAPSSVTSSSNRTGTCEDCASEASSILSSADAYVRRTVAGEIKLDSGRSEVRVSLNLRFVGGGNGMVASTLSLKRVAVVVPNLKNKRRKFDDKEKGKILVVAREHGVNEAVRRATNTAGFEHVTAPHRVILRECVTLSYDG